MRKREKNRDERETKKRKREKRETKREKREIKMSQDVLKMSLAEMLETRYIGRTAQNLKKLARARGPVVAHYHYKSSCRS